MRAEVDKFKEISNKAKVTNETVEIVKEVEKIPYGLSRAEVEKMRS